MKLLIIDDSQDIRTEIKYVVADIADEIYECGDGSDALAAYDRHRPDWVLMDIVMKEIDGLEATSLIKTSWPEARIVIVTSYDDSDLKKAARSAGAYEYVLKENLLELRRVLLGEATTKRLGGVSKATSD
jgi:CheY-like chemotaxis protein